MHKNSDKARERLANKTISGQSSRTMDIKSFVSEALEQLGAGISEARNKPGINISPHPFMDEGSNTAGGRLIEQGKHSGNIVNFVEFDLSVTVTKTAEGSAGAKAKLAVIGLDLGGAELKGGVDHTSVQRIKFQVPVSFPES